MRNLHRLILAACLAAPSATAILGCGGDPSQPTLTEQDKQNIADELKATEAAQAKPKR